MNKSQETAFKKFIIRYTVIGSVCTWLLATQLRDFLDAIVDNIAEPLFSMDINEDGKPDIEQVNKMILDVSGIKFPVGKILLGVIKTMLAVVLIYLMIQFLYRHTDLLKI